VIIQIKSNLEKEERRAKIKKPAGKPKGQENYVMEKYRKLSINDVIKKHDKNPHKIAL